MVRLITKEQMKRFKDGGFVFLETTTAGLPEIDLEAIKKVCEALIEEKSGSGITYCISKELETIAHNLLEQIKEIENNG